MPQPEPPPRDKLLDSLLDLSRRMRTDTSAYRSKAHKKIGRQGYRLDIRDLERHINGDGVARGQYLMLPGQDVTRVAVLDLDSHKGETPWEEMLAVAGELVEGLREQVGLVAQPWRSNGGKGVHLWFVWDEAQDSYSVRETLGEFLAMEGFNEGSGGVAAREIEIFPKQDQVEAGRFGSQVWLPLYGGGASAPLETDMVNGGLRLPRDGWRERLAVTGYAWRGSAAVAKRENKPRLTRLDKPKNKAAALLGLDAGVSVSAGEIARLSEMLATVGFDNAGGDDYTYNKWLTVGMGLHEAAAGGEAGLALWRDWSALGAGYGDAGAVEAKWDSFGRGTRERLVTVRSIEHMARGSGWVEDLSGMFETPQDVGDAGENNGPETGNPDLKTIDNPDESGESPGVLNSRNQSAIASRFLATQFNHKGAATLLRVNGDWFSWTGTHYAMRDDEVVRAAMRRFLDRAMKQVAVGKGVDKVFETVPFLPSVADVTGALDALGAAVLREGMEEPALMGGAAAPSGKYDALDLLALQDGLLHIPSRKLLAHTPAFFNTAVLPYSWKGSDGLAPRWVKFLGEVFPEDNESQETLQEIFGYLLTSDTSQQKMFLIQGEPRSGKGTIGRVIRDLIGADNVTGTSFKQLAGDFGLAGLIGKSLAILPESRNTGNRHGGMQDAVERLLTQTGEDVISIARKYKDDWNGKLRARFLMLANQVPALGDSSGAFASRFIVLRTAQSFLGREETELYSRLRCELPQIFKWSLDGLDRLRSRGHFRQPAYAAEALEDLADSNNHTRVFLREECIITGNGEDKIDKKELYNKYRDWCFSEGRSPDMYAVFCKNVIMSDKNINQVRGRNRDLRLQLFGGLKISNGKSF